MRNSAFDAMLGAEGEVGQHQRQPVAVAHRVGFKLDDALTDFPEGQCPRAFTQKVTRFDF